ncbi:hypothetical protein, partial [Xanthobacter autotrophicus]|uniref:hypothetical protein n=1 Tax=Xanthobacter autotrophicus TaxID=280 RepID=UPI00372A0936
VRSQSSGHGAFFGRLVVFVGAVRLNDGRGIACRKTFLKGLVEGFRLLRLVRTSCGARGLVLL